MNLNWFANWGRCKLVHYLRFGQPLNWKPGQTSIFLVDTIPTPHLFELGSVLTHAQFWKQTKESKPVWLVFKALKLTHVDPVIFSQLIITAKICRLCMQYVASLVELFNL